MRRTPVLLALAGPVLVMAAAFVLLLAEPARADNCDLRINPEDCQNTAWTVGTVAVTAAAITGILTALSGLGGTAGPPAAIGGAGTTPASLGGPAAEPASAGGPAAEPEGQQPDEGASEEDGGPLVRRQQWKDSCATVTSQMVIERVTGEKIPENTLRSESHQTPNGYRRNPAKFGTNPQGVIELLGAHGITARTENIDLGQMQQAIKDGKQISVSIKVTGGNHRVLVTNVEPSPTGRTIITFDDPATGTTRRMTDVGWANRGNPARTIVVDPR